MCLPWLMSDTARPDIDVTREDAKSRYTATIDGQVAGFAAYRRHGDRVVFTHTEVDPAFEGRGVGGVIARYALDDVRAAGNLTVTPLCPFIRTWIGRHPEYASLLAP